MFAFLGALLEIKKLAVQIVQEFAQMAQFAMKKLIVSNPQAWNITCANVKLDGLVLEKFVDQILIWTLGQIKICPVMRWVSLFSNKRTAARLLTLHFLQLLKCLLSTSEQ